MAEQAPALNARESLIELAKDRLGLPSFSFLIFMRNLRTQVEAAPAGFEAVSLTGQSASIGTTAIPTDGDLSAGVYRVTVYQRITTVDAVSSSVTTTLSWTDGSVACSFSGTALTGNTTATVGSFTFTMRIDAASPISYATTVALGSGDGRYRLNIQLERLSAE